MDGASPNAEAERFANDVEEEVGTFAERRPLARSLARAPLVRKGVGF